MTSLRPISLLLLAVTLVGCPFPVGRYALVPPIDPDGAVQFLDVDVRPFLENRGTEGWDLELQLEVAAHPGHTPWVDVGRVMLRVDGLRWLPCRAIDAETRRSIQPPPLRFLESQLQSYTLVCAAIARPNRSIEVRIPATGAGGKGYLELAIDGLRNSGLD